MTARPERRNRSPRKAAKPVISRWKLYAMMAVAGSILVAGTFFAARQHFLSWEYGMKNSRMRKQIDELETEKRRLLLARENSSSPSEIKRVVKKFGIADAPAAPELAVAKAPAAPGTAAASPKIERTADVKPANYTVVPAAHKPSAPPVKTVAKVVRSDRDTRREMAE